MTLVKFHSATLEQTELVDVLRISRNMVFDVGISKKFLSKAC